MRFFRIACMTEPSQRDRDPFGHPPLYLIRPIPQHLYPSLSLSVCLSSCIHVRRSSSSSSSLIFGVADQINMYVYDYDTRIVMLGHKYFYASATTLSRKIVNAYRGAPTYTIYVIQHFNLNLCTKSFWMNVVFRILSQLVCMFLENTRSESLLTLRCIVEILRDI